MKKNLIVLVLILLMILSLTSCSGKEKYKFSDGTTVNIEYDSSNGLARKPHFEKSGEIIHMSFNGKTYYTVSVVDKSVYDSYTDLELRAESSNIKVYKEKGQPGLYAYFISSSDTDSVYIKIVNSECPGMDYHSYGMDFDYCISYSINGKTVTPDIEGLKVLVEPTEEEINEVIFIEQMR